MKAPDKIYMSPAEVLYKGDKQNENDIEYTRTDAFIDKACEWLNRNFNMPDDFKEHFKRAMEGEYNMEDNKELMQIQAYLNEEIEKCLKKHNMLAVGKKDFTDIAKYFIEIGANLKELQFERERLKHCDALTSEQAQIESDFVAKHLKDNNRTPTFIDAIEHGMRLHKEQMMSKAIDAVVIVDRIGEVTYLCPHTKATSDKAKVIIIEED